MRPVERMRAARFHGPGLPLRVEELPVPELADDEVLVRVAAVGLCGSDVHIAVEGITPTGHLPITLGHEIAGTVATLGRDVRAWREGDRVCASALVSDLTCANCLAGRSEICLDRRLIGIHVDGGLAEYVPVPARNLVAVPDPVPLPVAAVVTDAVATPFHALVDVARVTPGESVVVLGVGGLGLHAVQIASVVGASPVIAVDVRQAQLARASAAGADVTVHAGEGPVVDAVLAATGGTGVDVAAEFVGRPDTIAQAVECLRTGGRAVVAGLGAEPITVLPPTLFVRKELQLLGSYGFTLATIGRLLQLIASGRLDLTASITHTFPLDRADEALRTLHEKTGDPQRVVVTP